MLFGPLPVNARYYGFGAIWLSLLGLTSACDNRTIHYAAHEDLVVGSHTVTLYTNGECAVEMGIGYHEGQYTLQGDTLFIWYPRGPLPGLPSQLLVTPEFLVTLPTAEYPLSTRIRRQ